MNRKDLEENIVNHAQNFSFASTALRAFARDIHMSPTQMTTVTDLRERADREYGDTDGRITYLFNSRRVVKCTYDYTTHSFVEL